MFGDVEHDPVRVAEFVFGVNALGARRYAHVFAAIKRF
jgi:hypothetical protein